MLGEGLASLSIEEEEVVDKGSGLEVMPVMVVG